jgi:polyhydroxyalkanoate synthesis regulator phasin
LPKNSDTDEGTQTRTITVQGIKDLIERTFMAGMGAAALTKDRIQELTEELVNRGQINADEGRAVMERLVARSRDEARAVLKRADGSLQTGYRELGLGSQRDLDEIALRLQQLEHRVQLLETQSDSQGQATP